MGRLLLFLWYIVVAAADIYPELNYDLFTAKVLKCDKSLVDLDHSVVLYSDEYHHYIVSSSQHAENCTVHANRVIQVDEGVESHDHHMIKRDADPLALFESYHNLSSMYDWYYELPSKYPDAVSIHTIGYSYHRRPLIAVHITHKSFNAKKPIIFVQCLLHSREWITGSMCMFLTNALTASSADSTIVKLLRQVEFVILPIANPDGYQLTWIDYPKYRLWRKNLSGTDPSCLGVDLNRNFDVHWSKFGSSDNKCSDVYHGGGPESESEVSAITSYLKNLKEVLLGSLDLHSFSQAVLYPNAWTKRPHRFAQMFKHLAQSVANAASQNGNMYKHEQMGKLYLASGTMTDWLVSDEFVNANNNPVSLTIELPPTVASMRDKLMAGFTVPPKQILPICREVLPSIIKFAKLLITNNLK